MEPDEYELIPMNPIRRVEKRIDRLEKNVGSDELMKDLMEIVKTNQQIVDEIVKTNSELVDKVGDMTQSVNAMITRLDDFMSRVEIEGEEVKEESNPEADKKMDDRLAKLEKRVNAILMSAMSKKMARPRMVQ